MDSLLEELGILNSKIGDFSYYFISRMPRKIWHIILDISEPFETKANKQEIEIRCRSVGVNHREMKYRVDKDTKFISDMLTKWRRVKTAALPDQEASFLIWKNEDKVQSLRDPTRYYWKMKFLIVPAGKLLALEKRLTNQG